MIAFFGFEILLQRRGNGIEMLHGDGINETLIRKSFFNCFVTCALHIWGRNGVWALQLSSTLALLQFSQLSSQAS